MDNQILYYINKVSVKEHVPFPMLLVKRMASPEWRYKFKGFEFVYDNVPRLNSNTNMYEWLFCKKEGNVNYIAMYTDDNEHIQVFRQFSNGSCDEPVHINQIFYP